MTKTILYEVVTKMDGESDFLIHNTMSDHEILYDETDIDSANDYAEKIGGQVVEVTKRILPSRHAK